MNRFGIYILFVLLFLVLYSSIYPQQKKLIIIENENDYQKLLEEISLPRENNLPPRALYSVILADINKTGFALKNYFHRYKIVSPDYPDKDIMIQTNRSFYIQTRDLLGMSLANIFSDRTINTTPTLPGAFFIGDKTLGHWKNQAGEFYWDFFKAYKDLPTKLGWSFFKPTKSIHRELIDQSKKNILYRGPENLFGKGGKIGNQLYKEKRKREALSGQKLRIKLNNYFAKLWAL